jgi:hypothetical protein
MKSTARIMDRGGGGESTMFGIYIDLFIDTMTKIWPKVHLNDKNS